jgi:hypothetical protein
MSLYENMKGVFHMKKVFKTISEVLVDAAKVIALIIMIFIITVRFLCDCAALILASFIKAVKFDEQISDTFIEMFYDYLNECEHAIRF